MPTDDRILPLSVSGWAAPIEPHVSRAAIEALEAGRIVVLPGLGFGLGPDDPGLLAACFLGRRRKNISRDPTSGRIAGLKRVPPALDFLMRRFAADSTGLVRRLLPRYAAAIRLGRTSFRPAEIAGRDYSPRQDDRRLHVDAFPSRPTHGERILRLFTNAAPDGRSRDWRVGERFEDVAARFLPALPKPSPLAARLHACLGLTKGLRSPYDEMMLALHDRMKLSADYQRTSPTFACAFPAGTTWLCFTDQVPHAALAGHMALEQTFHLPVTAMANSEHSPLRVLERLTGRVLDRVPG